MFAFDDSSKKMIDRLRQQGWVACEGQSVARDPGPNGLPDLFKVIGFAWGTDDKNAFNIPDLRGQFLRGWNHGHSADPDAKGRLPLKEGGIKEDNVGSSQPDEFRSHNHGIKGGSPFGMLNTDQDIAVMHPSTQQDRGNPKMEQGGQETRPRNVSVMYCIYTGAVPLPSKVTFFAS